MAAVAAGPAWRLLGAKDLGVTEDYRSAKMPPVNTGLLEGELAWRQHDGGHTDGPNWKYFIPWASRKLGWKAPPHPQFAPDDAVPRLDANSLEAHAELLQKAKQGKIDLYFLGDSITRRWGALDYPQFLEHWKKTFFGWNAANFGWGGDTTHNILWRIRNGELDGVNPKVVVLMAGTNNLGRESVEWIVGGIRAILATIHEKAPAAHIILMGITPRDDNRVYRATIPLINQELAKLAGDRVRFLDFGNRFLTVHAGFAADLLEPDGIHLSLKGYELWAETLHPRLLELLGPPASEDLAPPPTGDPSARKR